MTALISLIWPEFLVEFQRPLGRGEWGGCETGPVPSFSRRGGCAINKKIPFAAQTGWFVISNKIRIATRAYKEATRLFTNDPGPLCGLPSFERRGMNSLQQPVIDFEIACLTQRLCALHPLISQHVGQFGQERPAESKKRSGVA